MIRINLLPFRTARKHENIRKQISLFSLSLVLILLLLGSVHVWLGNVRQKLDVKIKNTKDQVAKYNKINEEISQIKKDLQNLQKKIDVITSLDNNRAAPVMLLDDMTKLIVPNQMWFTQFNTDGTTVNVDGIAMDNQTIAEFMRRVEGTGKYTNMRLESAKQSKMMGGTVNLQSFGVIFERVSSNNTTKKDEAKK